MLVVLWRLLSLSIAAWARHRGRRAAPWPLISIILSPVVGAALLAARRNLASPPAAPGAQAAPTSLLSRVRNSTTYHIVRNTLIAVIMIIVVIAVLNRTGMKSIPVAVAEEMSGRGSLHGATGPAMPGP